MKGTYKMKLLFASDIHGSAYYAELLKETYLREKADKLILLGDLLYHGPRNDLPREYAPKRVIQILNSLKDNIICVRGNCDTEVDQMVLDFPIMADYAVIYADNKEIFLTHGHKLNPDNPPPFKNGAYLMNGHTHIASIKDMDGFIYLNPGSVSIPKENTGHSYMIYENGEFTLHRLEEM